MSDIELGYADLGIDESWSEGPGWDSGTSVQGPEDVPGLYPVSIGGHEYVIEPSKFIENTIPPLRPSMDQAPEPGEVSLNNAGLWRRSQSDPRHGANQLMFDEADSDPKRSRYWTSKGLNPHPDTPADAYQMRMHKATRSCRTSGNGNLKLLPVGTHLYMVDGDELYWTTTLAGGSTTWTAAGMATATSGAQILDVTSDGGNVYCAVGAAGVYSTVVGATSSINFLSASHTVSVVAYANGILFAMNGPDINQVNATGDFEGDGGGSGATGLLDYTHPIGSFTWAGAVSTPHGIFCFGTSGLAGEMYLITVDPSTSELVAPESMFILPMGEGLNELCYYSGAIILATTAGVRVATVQITFSISATYGPVILIPGGVRSIFGYGQWAWFAWTNYDSVSTGLGRLDLARFATDLTPAMSSDLMAGTAASIVQGDVESVTNFLGTPCFAISGVGVYSEHPTDYIASGQFDTGRIKFGTTEPKLPLFVGLYHSPLPAGASIQVSTVDDSGLVTPGGISKGTGNTHPPDKLELNLTTAQEQVELIFTLNNGTDLTDPPVLRRWTLYAVVVPERVDQIDVPILLYSRVRGPMGEGADRPQDVLKEFLYLKDLENSQQPVLLRIGNLTYLVIVVGVKLEGTKLRPGSHEFIEGLCTVSMTTLGKVVG